MRPGFCACVWTSSCHGDRCTSSSSNTIRSARFVVFAKFWQFFRLIKSTHLSNHSTNIYLSFRSPYEPNTSHDRVITRKSHVGSPSWHTVLIINLPFCWTSNIAGGTLLESINGRMTWCFILHLWLTDRRSLFEQASIRPNINSRREFSSKQAVDLTGTHLSTAPPSTLSNSHTTGLYSIQHYPVKPSFTYQRTGTLFEEFTPSPPMIKRVKIIVPRCCLNTTFFRALEKTNWCLSITLCIQENRLRNLDHAQIKIFHRTMRKARFNDWHVCFFPVSMSS